MVRKAKGVGRGGPRQGTPGQAYPNRSDLNGPGGLPYGQNQQLQQSAQTMAQAGQATASPPPLPFNRPTERPDEPVTHGLPSGPGGGPEVLGAQDGADVGSALRGLLLASNNPDVMALVALWDQRQAAVGNVGGSIGGPQTNSNAPYRPIAPDPTSPEPFGRLGDNWQGPPPMPPGWGLDEGGVPTRKPTGGVGSRVRTQKGKTNLGDDLRRGA
jgi:hypothetical protein